MNKPLLELVEFIKKTNIDINFKIIEIGALQIQDQKEPFYELLDYFPSSKIIGFEIYGFLFFTNCGGWLNDIYSRNFNSRYSGWVTTYRQAWRSKTEQF